MRADEFMSEATNFSQFPDTDLDLKFLLSQLSNAVKLVDITANLSLWQKGQLYALFKDQIQFVGYVKISEREIAGKTYSHVDLIYIIPEFRKTSAIKWLIYAVKENTRFPIIADGAIFKEGQSLILSLIRHNASRVSALNKITGQKTQIDSLINDPELCYIFEANQVGFGKNYISEDQTSGSEGWIWYSTALFDEI